MARGDFVDANGIIGSQVMSRTRRSNFSRLLTVLLAVVMFAFPAAASAGLVGHCATGHADDVQHDCCAVPDAAGSEDHGSDPADSSGCTKCMHACCRTTADVVRGRVTIVIDQDVIVPILVPAESVHDPVTCDAIFHPPRA